MKKLENNVNIKMNLSSDSKKYGNCRVFSPEGKLMFLCNESRVKWYINRNLATIINENPKEIKLSFQPKGQGYSVDDEYFFTPKLEKCVCCGTEDYEILTRHHIVPYCYRKWMPDEHKNHNSYDVVKLCRPCHNIYEKEAQILKFKIAEDLDVNLNKRSDIKLSQLKGYANTLLYHLDKLPDEVFERMYQEISDFLGKEYLSDDELKKIVYSNYQEDADWKSWGRECIEKIENLDEFILMWRQHFIDVVHPKYMPKGWEVNKNIYRKK